MKNPPQPSPINEDIYRVYFANANLGLAVTSPAQGWLRVNPRLCEMLGYTEAELTQTNWADLTHPDDLAADEGRFNKLLAGEFDGYSLNKRFIRKDGGVLFSHLTVACERDANGQVQQVLATLSDRGEEEAALSAARISEERFNLLSESTLDGLWDWDLDAGALWLSPSWKAQLGWRDDELPNSFETWDRLIHADDHGRVMQHLQAFTHEPAGVWQETFRLAHRDGGWRQILARGIAVIGADSRLARIFGVHVDITQEREAVVELRAMSQDLERIVKERTRDLSESEARYRNIADYTFDWETWTDAEGKLRYCSPACESMTGHPARDFIADPGLLPRIIHRDDQQAWKEHVARIGMARGVHQVRFRVVWSNNTTRWLERMDQPMLADDGRFAGMRGSTRDITDTYQTQLALEQEKAFIETIFNTTRALILVLSSEARVVRVNPYIEELTGWPVEHVLGRDWIDMMLPEADRDQIRASFSEAFGARRTEGNVNEIMTRDGHLKYISWYDDILPDDSGKPALLVAVGIDVTAQRAAEQALNQALGGLEEKVRERTAALRSAQAALIQSEKLSSIGTMVASLSHEINNPLMGIINYVQFARERSETDVAMILNKADRELHRISGIIGNLLQFARPQTKALGAIRVDEPLRRASDLLAADLRARSITLQDEIPETLPRALADAGNLQQVCLNLLINARDAVMTREQRRIRLRGGEASGSVWIEVMDNGHGIPPGLRSRIFDPFFSTKAAGQGTGLGLSVSWDIIAEFGGVLAVRETGDDGSALRITLPIAATSTDQDGA